MDGIKALTFDMGGTILDWHKGVSGAFRQAGAKHGIERDWAAITNEYRRRSIRKMLNSVRPSFNIDDVHREMLEQVVTEHELDAFTSEDREALWRAWHELDAWPDFPEALAKLRKKYTVVSFTILSLSLILDVSNRNGIDWDCVISCEMIGVYKTQPESYRTAAKWLALQPHQIAMVACHNFDLMAARQEGYRSAFVHRPIEWGPGGPPDPTPDPAHDIVAQDYEELVRHLGA